MKLPRTPICISGVLVLSLFASSAAPVAAAQIKGEGYYARFAGGVRVGIVVVDKVDADSGRLNALLVGLVPFEEYSIIGRSIGCDGSPAKSNRVFRTNRLSDEDGAVSASSRAITMKDAIVTSVWIGRTGGGDAPLCRGSVKFETVFVGAGEIDGDGAVGAIMAEWGSAIALVEKRPNNEARVSIVVDPSDSSGNTIYVRGVNQPCGSAAPRTAWYAKFDGIDGSSTDGFKSKIVSMTQEQLDALQSFRVRDLTEGTNLGCTTLGDVIV